MLGRGRPSTTRRTKKGSTRSGAIVKFAANEWRLNSTYPPIMWRSNIPSFQAPFCVIHPTIAVHHVEASVDKPETSGAVAIHCWQVSRMRTGLPHIIAPVMCPPFVWAAIHPTMAVHQLPDGV